MCHLVCGGCYLQRRLLKANAVGKIAIANWLKLLRVLNFVSDMFLNNKLPSPFQV
jgi:hypothetical protein